MAQGCRAVILATLCALAGLSAGCASLSLFDSTHYHGTPEIEQRLSSLEKRVAAIESGGVCVSSQPLAGQEPQRR